MDIASCSPNFLSSKILSSRCIRVCDICLVSNDISFGDCPSINCFLYKSVKLFKTNIFFYKQSECLNFCGYACGIFTTCTSNMETLIVCILTRPYFIYKWHEQIIYISKKCLPNSSTCSFLKFMRRSLRTRTSSCKELYSYSVWRRSSSSLMLAFSKLKY